ncbi:hypothetical protein WT00_15890 [Burkholderia territorii]|nr:hypothetical protein WT00_15890 [Burkholderia territorii]
MPKLQPSGATRACRIAAARGVQRALDMDDVTFSFAGQRGQGARSACSENGRHAAARRIASVTNTYRDRPSLPILRMRQDSGGASRSTACSPVANGVA